MVRKSKNKKQYIIVPKKKIYTIPQQYDYDMKGGYMIALLGIGTILGTSLGAYSLYNVYNSSKNTKIVDTPFTDFKLQTPTNTYLEEDNTYKPITLPKLNTDIIDFSSILKETRDVYAKDIKDLSHYKEVAPLTIGPVELSSPLVSHPREKLLPDTRLVEATAAVVDKVTADQVAAAERAIAPAPTAPVTVAPASVPATAAALPAPTAPVTVAPVAATAAPAAALAAPAAPVAALSAPAAAALPAPTAPTTAPPAPVAVEPTTLTLETAPAAPAAPAAAAAAATAAPAAPTAKAAAASVATAVADQVAAYAAAERAIAAEAIAAERAEVEKIAKSFKRSNTKKTKTGRRGVRSKNKLRRGSAPPRKYNNVGIFARELLSVRKREPAQEFNREFMGRERERNEQRVILRHIKENITKWNNGLGYVLKFFNNHNLDPSHVHWSLNEVKLDEFGITSQFLTTLKNRKSLTGKFNMQKINIAHINGVFSVHIKKHHDDKWQQPLPPITMDFFKDPITDQHKNKHKTEQFLDHIITEAYKPPYVTPQTKQKKL